MKCHLCDNRFEIHTDPKGCDYVIGNGASRKNENWEPEDSETIRLKSEEEAEKLENPFYKLEHVKEDEKKSQESLPSLSHLVHLRDTRRDDFSLSQTLRRGFHKKRKELIQEKAENLKRGIFIPLLPENQHDKELAELAFREQNKKEETIGLPVKIDAGNNRRKRKMEIRASSIFDTNQQQSKKKLSLFEKVRKIDRTSNFSFSSSTPQEAPLPSFTSTLIQRSGS